MPGILAWQCHFETFYAWSIFIDLHVSTMYIEFHADAVGRIQYFRDVSPCFVGAVLFAIPLQRRQQNDLRKTSLTLFCG